MDSSLENQGRIYSTENGEPSRTKDPDLFRTMYIRRGECTDSLSEYRVLPILRRVCNQIPDARPKNRPTCTGAPPADPAPRPVATTANRRTGRGETAWLVGTRQKPGGVCSYYRRARVAGRPGDA